MTIETTAPDYNYRPATISTREQAAAERYGIRVTTAVRRDPESMHPYVTGWYHCPTCGCGWERLRDARYCCVRGWK